MKPKYKFSDSLPNEDMEKVLKENSELRRELEAMRKTLKTISERPVIKGKRPKIIPIKEKIVERVIVKVVEVPRVQEVSPEVKVVPVVEAAVSEIVGAAKKEKVEKVIETPVRKAEEVGKNKHLRSFVTVVVIIATFVGILRAFVFEEKHNRVNVGISRTTKVEVNTETSSMNQSAQSVSQPVVPAKSPFVKLADGFMEADKERVQEALDKAEIERKNSARRREELGKMSGFTFFSDASVKATEIREGAMKKAEDLRKRSKVKIVALLKKGKKKQADKLAAKTEKDVETLLNNSENKAKSLISEAEEKERRRDVLVAEENAEKETEDRLLGKMFETKQASGTRPTLATAQPKEDRFVYIINLKSGSDPELLIREEVDGKVSKESRAIGKIGRYSYSKYPQGVGLVVEKKGDKKPIVGGREFFSSGRWFWFFDGERMVKTDKVSPEIHKKLTEGEGS